MPRSANNLDPSKPSPALPPMRRLRLLLRKQSRPLRMLARSLLVTVVFLASILPSGLMYWSEQSEPPPLLVSLRTLPYWGQHYQSLEQWYQHHATPVQELRPLALPPSTWQGQWFDTDKNYSAFEKWFTDHLALRNLMIRSKNEIDYQLFNSSSRVYYGKHGELFGRNLADNELPLTEAVLDSAAKRAAVLRGLRAFAAQLARQGTTLLLIAPIEKQYYRAHLLPFFAPRIGFDSHFMSLYQDMKATPELHFIDVRALLDANQAHFPTFFRQDFHWTDPMAMVVAADTVRRIAELEGMPLRWKHPLEIEYRPFVGVEARFAARLNADDLVLEPQIKTTWAATQAQRPMDPATSGFEFDTAAVATSDRLPATCMYGNSFSDGMVRAGLTEHFVQFSKLSRALPLQQVPALIKGRCQYLILQVLDIQAGHWNSMAQ